ncbi:hypothetical protein FACS1894169_01140 [Bacteroidia bacterium]|nr:hypothetical protein FACS1894169_01140 [Bacteroidia bacterium]
MTISEVKKQITDVFISNETVKNLYGLEEGKTFEEQFLPLSLESIFSYTVASAIWLIYAVIEQFKTDIQALLRNEKAHTANWYATRAKDFQFGCDLTVDTDSYDNSALTDEQIEAAKIIKFAAATETEDQSILFLKIANENGGNKQPVTDVQLIAFKAYLGRIKDAGVRISVINAQPDDLRLELDIYYNPLILGSDGSRLDGADETPVQNMIRDYVSNLSFNGLYVNQSLVDRLQTVEGIEIAELKGASSRYGDQVNFTVINARSRPYAGYYKITDDNLILNFIANE